jgi:type II secretory pathway component PulF
MAANVASTVAQPARQSTLSGAKVKTRDLVNLTSQLAIMTRSGVDMASALGSLARQCKVSGLREILEDVHERVMGGNSVSESLAKYGHVFNETYIASIAAGEASGLLPDVLGQLATLLRGEMRLKNSVRTMMAYPMLLSGVSGMVLLALILFVLPKFAEIFSDFDAPLPVMTQLLIGVSDELRYRFWLWIPLIIGIGVGAFLFKRSSTGKRVWDRFTLNAPLVRDVTRTLMIGRSCRLLGVMVDAGVPLLDSLRLVRSSIKNTLYLTLFDRLEDDVLNGQGLAGALLESDFVPGAAAEMMVTAEKTGTLGNVTQLIGAHYEEEGEARLKEIVALLEPLITVAMGLIIAIIVMSVMLPLFDLSSAAKG